LVVELRLLIALVSVVVMMRIRVNIKGQSKGVVAEVTVETTEADDINTKQSDETLREAKRIFVDAETFCMQKMR